MVWHEGHTARKSVSPGGIFSSTGVPQQEQCVILLGKAIDRDGNNDEKTDKTIDGLFDSPGP